MPARLDVARRALAAAIALLPVSAVAHAPPFVARVALDLPDRIAVSTTRGIVATADGAATWSYACPASVGAVPGEAAAVAYRPDGALLVGTALGLFADGGDACSLEPVPGPLAAMAVVDLASTAAGGALWALTAQGGSANGLYRSDDGVAWAAVGPQEASVAYVALAAAADGSVLATSGLRLDPDAGLVAFVRVAVDPALPPAEVLLDLLGHEYRPRVLAIGPEAGAGPAPVFVAIEAFESTGMPDRLVRIVGTEVDALGSVPAVGGMALSADGGMAWLGAIDGLRVGAPESLSAAVPTLGHAVGAMRWDADGQLWACGDHLAGAFALGRAAGGVEPFATVMELADASLPGAGCVEAVGDACAAEVDHWRTEIGEPFGSDADVQGADAGGGDAVDGGPGGSDAADGDAAGGADGGPGDRDGGDGDGGVAAPGEVDASAPEAGGDAAEVDAGDGAPGGAQDALDPQDTKQAGARGDGGCRGGQGQAGWPAAALLLAGGALLSRRRGWRPGARSPRGTPAPAGR